MLDGINTEGSCDLNKLATEQRNKKSQDIDKFSSIEIVTLMNDESNNIRLGIAKEITNIAKVVEQAAETIKYGGRIIYLGAGTSGRLALLDAVECPPTFGVDYDVVVGLIAGGEEAFVKAQEGAEDSDELACEDLKSLKLSKKDFVIGVAASGRTPYVIGGLKFAKELGCVTASLAITYGSEVGKLVDLPIEIEVGPEVVTGSTRLKAGSAQKEILNMISTGAMIQNGKVYQNLMVDVKQTNNKLVQRAINIVKMATNCSDELAISTLNDANGHAKSAIIMILLNTDYDKATILLENHDGKIRKILDEFAV